MSENLAPHDMIRANADLVLAVARDEYGQSFGFDAEGVRWLDGYLQQVHEQGGVEDTETFCDQLGSFLGTCIIETYGGAWQETEHGWAVVLDGDLAVFPFNKTLKHLTEGAGDSVLGLFNSIPALIGHTGGTVPEAVPAEPKSSAKSLIGRIGDLFRRR
ncbi:MAG: hypothetical protein ACK4TL_09085 [Hyphomicrobiaceae bacterium]